MVTTGTSGGVAPFDDLTARLGDRDVRRAIRWLDRSGGLTPLPRPAGDLLAVRLAARARVLRRGGLPLGLLPAGWLGWWTWQVFREDDGFATRDRYGMTGFV